MSRLEVGNYYNVLCVRAAWGPFFEPRWLPVIGPLHEDRDIIGFPHEHYHVDYRFLGRKQARTVDKWSTSQPAHAIYNMPISKVRPVGTKHNLGLLLECDYIKGLDPSLWKRLMPRRCNALQVPVPYPSTAKWLPLLECEYWGATLKEGKICPHRGADLSSIPAVDGIIECPLHGLAWDAETGELHPRRANEAWMEAPNE